MPSMQIQVESTSLAAIGYDTARAHLEIEFRSGVRYRYASVPADVFTRLVEADSKGRFFNEHVRTRYAYERLG